MNLQNNNDQTKNQSSPAAFNLPYSPVRQVGDLYFISGHTGVNISTQTADSDIKVQVAKMFQNLMETLKSSDLGLEHIVKTTLFLTDMGDFADVNEVYATYFSDPKPVRTTVAVRELPRVADIPLKVEIEAVAFREA